MSTISEIARKASANVRRSLDLLWGYDVFISYRRADATTYAQRLHEQLSYEEINSFIDLKRYVVGDSLKQETIRHASKSTIFILVASPALSEPRNVDWVEAETDAYLASHGDSAKVIVIDFGEAIAKCQPGLKEKLAPFLRLPQSTEDLDDPPSIAVKQAVRQQLGGRRRDRVRLRVFQAITAALLLLSIGLALLAYVSIGLRNSAEVRLTDAQKAESRFLAEKAASAPDAEVGLQSAIQGLPKYESERAFEEAAWTALVTAESNRSATRVIAGVRATNLAWDPQGKRIAAATDTGVEIWDAATGRRRLAIPTNSYIKLAWNHDGTMLATTSGMIFDSTDGTKKAEFSGAKLATWAPRSNVILIAKPEQASLIDIDVDLREIKLTSATAIVAASWNLDGSRLLTSDADGRLSLVDAASGKTISTWSLDVRDVSFLDWTLDGKTAAVGSDNKIVLWDLANARPLANLTPNYARSVEFSPDGAWLMVATGEAVTLYGTLTGKQINALAVGAEKAVISPDGQAISIAVGGGVYFWDWLRGRSRWLRNNGMSFDQIAWSPDKRHVASASSTSLLVTDKNKKAPPQIEIFTTAAGWLNATPLPPDYRGFRDTLPPLTVSLTADRKALVAYDFVAKREVARLSSNGKEVTGWNWKPDGTRLLVFFTGGLATLWSAKDGFQAQHQQSNESNVVFTWWGEPWVMTRSDDGTETYWSPDKREIVSYHFLQDNLATAYANGDSSLLLIKPRDSAPELWDMLKAKRVVQLAVEPIAIREALFSPKNQQLLTVTSQNVATLWNVKSGKAIRSWDVGSITTKISWSPDENRFVAFDKDQAAQLLDAQDGRSLGAFKNCWSASWSPDSSRVLFGCSDKGYYVKTLDGSVVPLTGTDEALSWEGLWDPTGEKVLVTRNDDVFEVLDSVTGNVKQRISIPEPWIVRGMWDKDGRKITIFSGDRIVSAFGQARVFDVETGKQISVLKGHEKNILGGQWDPSGRYLITWSQDTTARVWDAENRRLLGILRGHHDFVVSGAWSDDGRNLTTTYVAPPPYVWPSEPFMLGTRDRIDWIRASLALPEIAGDSTEETELAEDLSIPATCERSAENPADPARRFDGVQFDLIPTYPPSVAMACEKAVAETPTDGRLQYLYGRTLRKTQPEKAREALDKAVKAGYAMASVDLGEMLIGRKETNLADFISGENMLQAVSEEIPIANVVLAKYYVSINADRAQALLANALAAGEPRAFEQKADMLEHQAMGERDLAKADQIWLEAYKNWSIAYARSRHALKRQSADWEFALARRGSLAWYLGERGRMKDVIEAYREANKVIN
ncbi:WD40 domain-containing protein (plasmid) [Rhizobium leguminosarum]